MRYFRLHLAHAFYELARVDDDPHMRRTLRRLAARILPRRQR